MHRRDIIKAGAMTTLGAVGATLATQPAQAAPLEPALEATLQAHWTHGTALQVENPEACDSITRFGWGTDLKILPGQTTWIHVPLNSPVVHNGKRARMYKAFMLFEAQQDEAFLRDFHVFDGPKRIFTSEDMRHTGNHNGGLDSANTYAFPARDALWGAGISVRVEAAASCSEPALFRVSSAGADYSA